jgi:hypothetical protein
MSKEIAVDEFLVEMGGYDLAEQLSIWLEENDWSGHNLIVSFIPDSEFATVQFEHSYYTDLAGKILASALLCALSEDFELVSFKDLKGPDGRSEYSIFIVSSL